MLLGPAHPLQGRFYWTAPNYDLVQQQGVALPLAPILRLAKDELSEVTRLLDLHDLTNLYLAGCSQLWNSIKISTYEVRKMPLYGGVGRTLIDPRVIAHNPSSLLSHFTALKVLQLHSVTWIPLDGASSPLDVLPATLERLDYSCTAPGQYEDSPFLRNFDYATAFPRLRTLRLGGENAFHLDVDLTPKPTPSFPPSLTVLVSVEVFTHEEVLAFFSGLPSNSEEASNSLTGALPCKLPHLCVLQLHFTQSHDVHLPPKELLPPRLVALQWTGHRRVTPIFAEDQFFNYDEGQDLKLAHLETLESAEARKFRLPFLRSVTFDSEEEANIDWIASLSGELESIDFMGECGSHELMNILSPTSHTPHPSGRDQHYIFSRIKSLNTWDWSFPGVAQPYIDAARFSSLTSLTIDFLDSAGWYFLPSTLTALRVNEGGDDASNHLTGLPQGLLLFTLENGPLDIGVLAQLPRSLLHLYCSLTNEGHIGTQLLQLQNGSFPNDGLPYDQIKGSDNILIGLPPNLESLVLIGDFQLDERFAIFLPRSLRILDTFSDASIPSAIINISGANAIKSKLSSWFGGPTEEEQVDASIRKFLCTMPSGCASNITLSRSLASYIGINDLRRHCPRMERKALV